MLRASHLEEGVCYTSPYWRQKVAMDVLAQAHRIFAPTSRIRKLEQMKAKVSPRTERQMVSSARFFSSLDVPVVDAFRIATCFENLFKARLLLER